MANSILKIFRQPNIRNQALAQIRKSSYQSSLFVEDVKVTTKFKEEKNPEEWKYVERLLPPTIVPKPVQKSEYPSGWKPQRDDVEGLPYFIERTKNYMIPVYLHIRDHGVKRITIIRKIQGDIWQFEKDIRPFLEDLIKPKLLRLRVDEFARKIEINGDHVNAIKYWLEQRNL